MFGGFKAKAKDLKVKAVVGTAIMKENRIINSERKAATKSGKPLLDSVRLWGAVARILIVLCRYYGPEMLAQIARHNVVVRGILRGLLVVVDLAVKAAKALKLA